MTSVNVETSSQFFIAKCFKKSLLFNEFYLKNFPRKIAYQENNCCWLLLSLYFLASKEAVCFSSFRRILLLGDFFGACFLAVVVFVFLTTFLGVLAALLFVLSFVFFLFRFFWQANRLHKLERPRSTFSLGV